MSPRKSRSVQSNLFQPQEVALLLGAGFSAWAAELPLASGLFDFHLDVFGAQEEKRLELVKRLKSEWDSKNPRGSAEQYIARALLENVAERTAVLWYIVRRLSDPYIWSEWHAGKWRRHVLMIDENRKLKRPGVALARDFFRGLTPFLTGIVTPNYDLLVEYGLGSKLFNYGQVGEVLSGRGAYPVSTWLKPVTLTGAIPISKLHGSISWDGADRYTDGRRGLTGRALIVAPVPEKTAPASLADVWYLAAQILQHSETIMVFGFGFNPYDHALLQHLRENGRRIKRAILVDIRPNTTVAQTVWPNARITTLSPPPRDEGGLHQWLAQAQGLFK